MEAAQRFGTDAQRSIAGQNCRESVSPETIVAVAVIDDDTSVRKSLVRSIQAAGDKVEGFGSAADFLGSVVAEDTSCVVSDLRMPRIDGLQLQESLRSKIPFLSIVFVTGRGDILTGVNAMKAGAIDFLEKPVRRNMLLETIACAVERTRKLRAAAAEIENLKRQYERLTPRGREVFDLVSAGLLNKQVAAQLRAVEKTVKQHRGSIMRKIDAESLADLVVMAERLGVRRTNGDFAQAKGKVSA